MDTIHTPRTGLTTKIFVGSTRNYYGSITYLNGQAVKVIGLPGDELDMKYGNPAEDDMHRGYTVEFIDSGDKAYNVHRDSLR
jgi:hypothetical protein